MSDAATTSSPIELGKPTRVRYQVVAVATLMSMLLYLDRFCISFVEMYIQEDLRLTNSQVAWMLSAFFWTYALAQVPTGWLTDRFGSRTMLTVYVLMWSLFTGLTGGVAAFTALMLLRFGFGVSQAGAYPTASSIVSRWMPLQRRGSASGVIAFGGRVGGVLALFASGYLLVWLTPLSTPTELNPEQFLNAPLVAHQLMDAASPSSPSTDSSSPGPADVGELNGPVDESARATTEARQVIYDSLTDDGRRLVSVLATSYQSALDARIAALKSEGKSTDNVVVETTSPKGQHLKLARELNRLLAMPGLFQSTLSNETLKHLPAESEAKRLLSKNPLQLEPAVSQRVNRLMLEATLPDGIQKLYVAGWRRLMFFYGSIGIIVAGLIWYVCRTDPHSHPRCNLAEQTLIQGERKLADKPAARVPLKALVSSRSMWLCCMTQWFTNIGWLFLVTWAPRYYLDVHQLPTETRSLYVAIPPFIGWMGMLSGGMFTDWVVRRVGLRMGRVLPISISRFLAMFAYIGCLFHPSPIVAVMLFSVVAFSTDLGTAPIWAFTQDVGGKQVGSVLGWGNMWGNLGAAVTPPLLIWVIGEQENWDYAFMACAGAFFISGVCAMGIDATIPIVDDK